MDVSTRRETDGAPGEDSSRARYLAIITDGNGRWAQARGLPVSEGHSAGADTVKARRRRARGPRAHRVLVLNRELVASRRGGPGADEDVREAHLRRDARAARGGRAHALHRTARGRPGGPAGAHELG